MNFFSLALVVIYILQILSLVIVIFVEDKNPVSTLSWMLVLTFLPIVGFIIYLFFGRGLKDITSSKRKLSRALQEQFASITNRTDDYFLATQKIVAKDDFAFNDPEVSDYAPLIRLSNRLCYTQYSQNNMLKIFTDAKEKYDCLFEDIRNAKSSIHLMYFIISDTDVSHRLIDLLAQKASEGVEVCVIYDELGNFVVPSKMFNKIPKAGGEVHNFFPLTFKSILHANYRNHHKIVVIDGLIGYTGGMNIGDEYMGLHPRKTPWRDTHIRVTGDIVAQLQSTFILDLYYVKHNSNHMNKHINAKYFPTPIETGDIGMQLILSGADDRSESIKRILISMINSAKKTLYIQTPYLMPDPSLMEAIQNAASSGVDVRVMIPGVPDKHIPYLVTFYYIQTMLDYGVKVYIHKGFLHAKMVVADDKISTIGTTNMDMRSLSLHFEMNTVFYDTKTSFECGDIFRSDLNDCKEMDKETYKKRGILQKVLERIFRLLAPLM